MTKLLISLTDPQTAWLREEAVRLDLPGGVSELVRRLVDERRLKVSIQVPSGYAFWQHRSGGEIYAVHTDKNGYVVGSCGPLSREECWFEELPNYDFATENAEWIEARCEEFRLVEPNDLV